MSSSARRLELRVGLLIVAGLVATVIIILISDRISFDRDYRVTAFLEDAGGLRSGSPVTLAGIRIGKVQAINTDSGDQKYPIKAVLAINEAYVLPADSTLTVATSGIFGDSYLAFAASTNPASLATDGSAKVFASPGLFDAASKRGMEILSQLQDLLGEQTRDDAKRLVHNAADLSGHAVELARNLRANEQRVADLLNGLDRLVDDLGATTHALAERSRTTLDGVDRAVAAVEELADHGDTAVIAATGAITRADDLMATTGPVLTSTLEQLRELSGHASAIAGDLRAGRGAAGQLLVSEELAADLNEVAINLSLTSRLLLEHPEALVFGNTREGSIELRQRRERLRLRRAFQEGHYRTSAPAGLPQPTLLEAARAHAARDAAASTEAAPQPGPEQAARDQAARDAAAASDLEPLDAPAGSPSP